VKLAAILAIIIISASAWSQSKLPQLDIAVPRHENPSVAFEPETTATFEAEVVYPNGSASGIFQKPGAAIFFNFCPGFGVGSFIQGDTRWGWALAVGDAIAYGFYGAAMFTSVLGDESKPMTSSEERKENALAFTGMGILVLSRVVGIIRPIKYYHRLKEREGAVLGVLPTLAPSEPNCNIPAQPGALLTLSY
jgi:hypothetical protein